jgi:hypothetical protein
MTEPMRSPAVDGSTGNVPDRPSQDVVLGLHEAHRRVGAATARLFDTAAHAYAVTELLVRKGVIEVDELDRSRRDVEERLGSAFGDDGLEISIAAEGPDKYELGCAVRRVAACASRSRSRTFTRASFAGSSTVPISTCRTRTVTASTARRAPGPAACT